MSENTNKERTQPAVSITKVDGKHLAELRESYAERRQAVDNVVSRLEKKYADRGLKFTVPFAGDYPVQAFGHLDGMRFYFRFRHNWANLRVGPYDEEIETLTYQRLTESYEKRVEEYRLEVESGNFTERDAMLRIGPAPRRSREDNPDFLPTRVVKSFSLEGEDPEDVHRGNLEAEECFDVFSRLVESLKDLPEEEQMHERTRIWLYEGWKAAEAYDDAWKENWMREHAAEFNP